MKYDVYAWIISLPIGAVLGWFGNRILGPSVDELGAALRGRFLILMNRQSVGINAYRELETLVRENHAVNGHRRFSERKTYLGGSLIRSYILKHKRLLPLIRDAWIEEAEILNYDGSDVFFAGMEILLPKLRKKDVRKFFEKFKENDQAAMWPFLELLEERRPKLLSLEEVTYLRKKQLEWEGWMKKHDQKP